MGLRHKMTKKSYKEGSIVPGDDSGIKSMGLVYLLLVGNRKF